MIFMTEELHIWNTSCWSCNKSVLVGLIYNGNADAYEDKNLQKIIQKHIPNWQLCGYKDQDWSPICSCGAKQGNFYILKKWLEYCHHLEDSHIKVVKLRKN